MKSRSARFSRQGRIDRRRLHLRLPLERLEPRSLLSAGFGPTRIESRVDDNGDGITESVEVETRQYDGSGNLIYRETTTDSNNDGSPDNRQVFTATFDSGRTTATQEEEFRYDDRGLLRYGSMTRTEFDAQGRRISLSSVETSDFDGTGFTSLRKRVSTAYDRRGHRTQQIQEFAQGENAPFFVNSIYTATYDRRGHRTAERFDQNIDEDGIPDQVQVSSWAYDPRGRLRHRVQSLYTDAGGFLEHREIQDLRYGPTSRPIQDKTREYSFRRVPNRYEFFTVVATSTARTLHYVYNSCGKPMSITETRDDAIDGSIELRVHQTFQYDRRGSTRIQTTEYDTNRDGVTDSRVIDQIRSNRQGLLLSYRHDDFGAGEYTLGWTTFEATYTSQGKPIREVYEQHRAESGTVAYRSTTTSEYDRNGLRTKSQKAIESRGDGVRDGLVTTLTTYDAHGHRVAETFEILAITDVERRLVTRYDATYDPDGRLRAESLRKDFDGDGITDNVSSTDYSY